MPKIKFSFMVISVSICALMPSTAYPTESNGFRLSEQALDWNPRHFGRLMEVRARGRGLSDRISIDGASVWSRENTVQEGSALWISFNANINRSISIDNNADHDVMASNYVVSCRTIQHAMRGLPIHTGGSLEMQYCNVLDRGNENRPVDEATKARLLSIFRLPQRNIYMPDLAFQADRVGPTRIDLQPQPQPQTRQPTEVRVAHRSAIAPNSNTPSRTNMLMHNPEIDREGLVTGTE